MAFCTACGATLDNAARLCPKCGAGVAASAVSPAPAQAAPMVRQNASRNALSIVLIVLAVVVALGAMATVGTVFALKRMARRVRVEAGPNSAVVTTPFGTITADEPTAVAQQLGVEVYPGAHGIKGSAAVGFGGMQVAAAKFESDATPEKIIEFYRRKYPKAAFRVVGSDNSMVFSTDQGMVTIKVHARGDGSLLEIARVGGVGGGASTHDDGPKSN
ncbi:MAG: zinc ribbon domain-containing protein [Acidobacteriia bacterium]|nr:zinc ribbon domain-containing protein [Terriglobia bacterium]